MNRYKQLLTYIKTAVTRNYSEKSINSILDYISTSKQVSNLFLETKHSLGKVRSEIKLHVILENVLFLILD